MQRRTMKPLKRKSRLFAFGLTALTCLLLFYAASEKWAVATVAVLNLHRLRRFVRVIARKGVWRSSRPHQEDENLFSTFPVPNLSGHHSQLGQAPNQTCDL